MKKLPKYLLKQLNDAIDEAKIDDDHYDDWEIQVQHWGNPNNHLYYYGKSLDEALDIIPSTYSHTNKDGVDLVVIQIKKQKLDEHKDIIDTHWIYELEMSK